MPWPVPRPTQHQHRHQPTNPRPHSFLPVLFLFLFLFCSCSCSCSCSGFLLSITNPSQISLSLCLLLLIIYSSYTILRTLFFFFFFLLLILLFDRGSRFYIYDTSHRHLSQPIQRAPQCPVRAPEGPAPPYNNRITTTTTTTAASTTLQCYYITVRSPDTPLSISQQSECCSDPTRLSAVSTPPSNQRTDELAGGPGSYSISIYRTGQQHARYHTVCLYWTGLDWTCTVLISYIYPPSTVYARKLISPSSLTISPILQRGPPLFCCGRCPQVALKSPSSRPLERKTFLPPLRFDLLCFALLCFVSCRETLSLVKSGAVHPIRVWARVSHPHTSPATFHLPPTLQLLRHEQNLTLLCIDLNYALQTTCRSLAIDLPPFSIALHCWFLNCTPVEVVPRLAGGFLLEVFGSLCSALTASHPSILPNLTLRTFEPSDSFKPSNFKTSDFRRNLTLATF
jgi:hypothetical protein